MGEKTASDRARRIYGGAVLEELKQMTCDVVRELKQNKAGLICPVCRRGTIIRGRTRYGCSRWQLGCNYAEPFEP